MSDFSKHYFEPADWLVNLSLSVSNQKRDERLLELHCICCKEKRLTELTAHEDTFGTCFVKAFLRLHLICRLFLEIHRPSAPGIIVKITNFHGHFSYFRNYCSRWRVLCTTIAKQQDPRFVLERPSLWPVTFYAAHRPPQELTDG